MAFEELKAQIGMLLGGLEDQPEDKHELYELIREKLAQMRAMGMPLPNDLGRARDRARKAVSKRHGQSRGLSGPDPACRGCRRQGSKGNGIRHDRRYRASGAPR